jgi:hypothetical protein
MAPQDTPERGAKASRHRRPTRLSGVPAGVFKHLSFINGCGFADARLGLDMYPPQPRFRREYTPFMDYIRCVPAGTPQDSNAINRTQRISLLSQAFVL